MPTRPSRSQPQPCARARLRQVFVPAPLCRAPPRLGSCGGPTRYAVHPAATWGPHTAARKRSRFRRSSAPRSCAAVPTAPLRSLPGPARLAHAAHHNIHNPGLDVPQLVQVGPTLQCIQYPAPPSAAPTGAPSQGACRQLRRTDSRCARAPARPAARCTPHQDREKRARGRVGTVPAPATGAACLSRCAHTTAPSVAPHWCRSQGLWAAVAIYKNIYRKSALE